MKFRNRRSSAATRRSSGFLARLLQDRRGNTLAILAVALIPIMALAGSAIDVARVYVVKVRLQQACDAGVLAGRKFMTIASTSSTLEENARVQAQAFFRNNFPEGWLGTTALNFTPVKANESDVSGTATTTVPMTIMKLFGFSTKRVDVTCTARYDVADTDVMFVLDVTGSMACPPEMTNSDCGKFTDDQGDANRFVRPDGAGITGYAIPVGYAGTNALSVREAAESRISALRRAVLAFYDSFAATADASTHVRYGFVPYASSVNVGQAILDVSSSYLVGSGGPSDMPFYQTRYIDPANAEYVVSTAAPISASRSPCSGTVRNPASGFETATGTATSTSYSTATGQCMATTSTLGPVWTYDRHPLDISALVKGGRTMTDPTRVRGETISWPGCVESPTESSGQSSFWMRPAELDPDLKPSGAQRWWPHLQNVEYRRPAVAASRANGESGVAAKGSYWNFDTTPSTDPNFQDVATCPKPAKRLGVMTRDEVSRYVNAIDFAPMGGTYHDIGMIWGARFMSPDGPWANDTSPWPGRNAPNRVVVFLTDGAMSPQTKFYSMYGLEALDRRIGPGASGSALTDLHNARFLAACEAAKAKDIQVWTVTIAAGAVSTMRQCATTPDQALVTTTGPDLADKFKVIAEHIATLRIAQ